MNKSYVLWLIGFFAVLQIANSQSVRSEYQVRFLNFLSPTNYILIKAPDDLNSVISLTLPSSLPQPNQVLAVEGISGEDLKLNWTKVLPQGAENSGLRYDGSKWICCNNLTNTGESIGIGTNSPLQKLHVNNGSILISGEGSLMLMNQIGDKSTSLKSGQVSNDLLFTLPNTLGSSGSVLQSDGNGNMSWSQLMPPGVILPYAGLNAPDGWHLCDGSQISRNGEGAVLFAVVGVSYGSGDGVNTFNLPDMRGRFPLGADNMGGMSAERVENSQADFIGGNDGEEYHVLSIDEMPEHNHIFHYNGSIPGGTNMNNDYLGKTSTITVTPNRVFHQNSIDKTGGSESHNNMPPFVTLNYIIKL